MNGIELTREIAAIADEKQAEDVVALEVGPLVGYTDAIVVCTARNERLAKAIQDEVSLRLKKEKGMIPARSEGSGEGGWILLDYIDCILHVFTPEARDRYRLDQLWGEADRIELGLELAAPAESASG